VVFERFASRFVSLTTRRAGFDGRDFSRVRLRLAFAARAFGFAFFGDRFGARFGPFLGARFGARFTLFGAAVPRFPFRAFFFDTERFFRSTRFFAKNLPPARAIARAHPAPGIHSTKGIRR
jgi:hypothetical protein